MMFPLVSTLGEGNLPSEIHHFDLSFPFGKITLVFHLKVKVHQHLFPQRLGSVRWLKALRKIEKLPKIAKGQMGQWIGISFEGKRLVVYKSKR